MGIVILWHKTIMSLLIFDRSLLFKLKDLPTDAHTRIYDRSEQF